MAHSTLVLESWVRLVEILGKGHSEEVVIDGKSLDLAVVVAVARYVRIKSRLFPIYTEIHRWGPYRDKDVWTVLGPTCRPLAKWRSRRQSHHCSRWCFKFDVPRCAALRQMST